MIIHFPWKLKQSLSIKLIVQSWINYYSHQRLQYKQIRRKRDKFQWEIMFLWEAFQIHYRCYVKSETRLTRRNARRWVFNCRGIAENASATTEDLECLHPCLSNIRVKTITRKTFFFLSIHQILNRTQKLLKNCVTTCKKFLHAWLWGNDNYCRSSYLRVLLFTRRNPKHKFKVSIIDDCFALMIASLSF